MELGSADNGCNYALKKLNIEAFSPKETPGLIRRFKREVRYQSQINHPNVVEVIEYNLNTEPPRFVMPLAIGSLKDDIESDRTLGGNPKKPLFDILAGLEAIHNQGFYHRDLKPANVLKFETNEGGITYKVSDFGMATPGVGQTTTLTGSNMAGGTVMYRSPECANNFKRATAQADIYSFGAILHDIFHGGTRVPHSMLSVSGPIGRIVKKCTETNAHRRYRSVARLREDLYEVLENVEIEFESKEERDIIELISNSKHLDDEQWDQVFHFIDENDDRDISNYNILRAITADQIENLFKLTPDMFHALGGIYAKFAKSYNFPFDYCDVVLHKATIFYQYGDLQLKAKIALAMLELGTSHNRWCVEHQFMRMVNSDVEDALADRIKIEIQVQELNFLQHIEHIEESIGATRDELHPKLREYLSEL